MNPNLLTIRDSRTGSVVDMQVLDNGHVVLTGKAEGTAYIQYYYKGRYGSVRVDVIGANGTRAGKGNATPLYWAKG